MGVAGSGLTIMLACSRHSVDVSSPSDSPPVSASHAVPDTLTMSVLLFVPHTLSLSAGCIMPVTCEGVKRGESGVWSWGKLFGAILFFGTFSDCL